MKTTREENEQVVDVLMDLREQIKELKHKVSDLEIMDEVTQLYNRKSLYNILDYEVKRARRYPSPLSVLLLRINNYNSIKEKLDQKTNILLEQIAKLLKLNIRDTDIIGRFSTDTFMLILPGSNFSRSEIIGERLQRLIEMEVFLNEIKVTINVGIKEYEGEYTQSLIDIAFQNLFIPKKQL